MRITALYLALMCILSINIYAQETEPVEKSAEKISVAPAETPAFNRPKNTFYLHPIDLLTSTLKLSYERDFGKKSHSIMLTAGLLLKDGSQTQEMGIGGELHLRLTILKVGKKKGFGMKIHAGPFITARYIDRGYTVENCLAYDPWTYECTDLEEIGNGSYVRAYGGGLIAGVRLTFAEKIVIGVHVGGQARYADYTAFENKYYENYFNENIVDSDFFPFSILNELDTDVTKTGIFPMAGFQVGFAF